jgi:hypothetical protein
MAPTCFGLLPLLGSLQLSLAKVILILKHSVRLLFGGVAACPSMARVLFSLQSTVHSTHVTLGHATTPPNNIFTECFNINITLARLNCKLHDDGRRPKHVGAI